MTPQEMLEIDRPAPEDKSQVTEKSKHYLAFICHRPGVVTMLKDGKQKSRTTAHHIVKRGVGKKGPDWWSIPVSFNRHVHGKHSIDKLGKNGFLEHFNLPDYEWMALIFLNIYLKEQAYKHDVVGQQDTVSPRPIDKPSAHWYFNLLQTLIKNDKSSRAWHWEH